MNDRCWPKRAPQVSARYPTLRFSAPRTTAPTRSHRRLPDPLLPFAKSVRLPVSGRLTNPYVNFGSDSNLSPEVYVQGSAGDPPDSPHSARVRPLRSAIAISFSTSGLSGAISRSMSANRRDAPRREVIDNMAPPPWFQRNQCGVRLLGLGLDSLIGLPTDAAGRLSPAALRSALENESDLPTVVVLQAGDLNIGAFDSFNDLIPIAHEFSAWVHVDGAFGLWAAASQSLRRLTEGMSEADSWVTDGHKWLNVPYDCGYVFVADAAAQFASVSHRESYMLHVEGARDQIDWNPEWSRRGRGVVTYAALRQLGARGVEQLVDNCCAHARALVDGIGSLPDAEVTWRPDLNQGLVRFLDPHPDAGLAEHDRYTDAIISAINITGEAFFGGTNWRGKRCMRVSVCSWRTTAEDVERTIAALARVLAEYANLSSSWDI